jgi:hypothetical protein
MQGQAMAAMKFLPPAHPVFSIVNIRKYHT